MKLLKPAQIPVGVFIKGLVKVRQVGGFFGFLKKLIGVGR